MRNLFFIILVLSMSFCEGQSIADAKPLDGYRRFRDSTQLDKPLLVTVYKEDITRLRLLQRDTINNQVVNTSSLYLPGWLRVDEEVRINTTDLGAYGFQMYQKNAIIYGQHADATSYGLQLLGSNGGNRFLFRNDGLAMFGYGTAPSVQSGTSLYANRIMIGNDDAGYLHLSRYNAGTPYATILASESATTNGTAGIQLITHESGTQRIGLNLEANGAARFLKEIRIPEVSTPSTPASGHGLYYFKSDGLPYALNDAGTEMVLFGGGGGTLSKGLTVESPSASESIGMWQTPVAITVTSLKAVLVGSSSPSVTVNIAFGTDRTSGTNVFSSGQTVTSTTTGHSFSSSFNDATIPAGSFIWFITTAQSGTVVQIELTLNYTED